MRVDGQEGGREHGDAPREEHPRDPVGDDDRRHGDDQLHGDDGRVVAAEDLEDRAEEQRVAGGSPQPDVEEGSGASAVGGAEMIGDGEVLAVVL